MAVATAMVAAYGERFRSSAACTIAVAFCHCAESAVKYCWPPTVPVGSSVEMLTPEYAFDDEAVADADFVVAVLELVAGLLAAVLC
jgi:hypothetical protein